MSASSTLDRAWAHSATNRLAVFATALAVSATALLCNGGRSANATPTTTTNVTAGVIATALAQLGTPYKYGAPAWTVKSATSTKCAVTHNCTFDCSSLVQYSFERHGIAVPRTTAEQWKAGKRIPLDKVYPGDIVFFSDKNKTAAGIAHVGILIGNGKMVEAPHTGATVRVATWKDRQNVMPYAVRLT